MFDEVKKPNEPEDIFAGTDKTEGTLTEQDSAKSAGGGAPPQPQAPSSGPMPAMSTEKSKVSDSTPVAPQMTPPPADNKPTPPPAPKGAGRTLKVILIVVIVVLVIVAAGLISYFVLNRAPADDIQVDPNEIMEEDTMTEDEDNEVMEEDKETEEDSAPVEPAPEPSDSFDTDRDGLSDVRETELGTSPRISDTDADGLSDYEEVKTWKTDPLDPDTDGDTYLDGDEVSNGYDPNGSGKLTDLPTTP